jgi:uncharacterized protein YidB (DUF937 family)
MDLHKFLGASFSPREATVEVPELSDFFADGEKAEWTVRSLTAAEMGRAELAAEKGVENIKALVEAMAGKGEKAEALRKAMGISQAETPADVSRRIEMLTAGSVSPELGMESRDVAVRLAEVHPTVFYKLTNKILSLTGQGAELGKRNPSGKIRKSAA